jgi:hypothetical protein
MTERLYARLRENVNLRLRRGAWYRVLHLADMDAVLEVNNRPRKVLRALLEIVKRPPPRWTVVTQPLDGPRKAPPGLEQPYGVCPSCGERASLPHRVRKLRCPYCKWEFPVGWDEPYPA